MTQSRKDFLIDCALGGGLALVALAAFGATLAPTVLDGDAALFQYTPFRLGVTYPTGYPVYILLARLWLSVFPFGELAWRMNLFSALSAAAAMPFIYGVAKRILQSRLGALSSVLLFATLPTFWRWATEAKIYTLNILLFSIVLRLATMPRSPASSRWRRWVFEKRMLLGAAVLGLQIGVHSTTVLLIPGIVWLFWVQSSPRPTLDFRPETLKRTFWILAAFAVPAALYLYVPIRAEMLIGQMGRATAIRHGLLSDFYQSGIGGWVRYFTAADFTGGVVSDWGSVPQRFWTVYLKRLMMTVDFGTAGVLWGAAGMLIMSLWGKLRRYFPPLFLLYALPIPFVLTYGRGEQTAFLLPGNLIFSIFAGALVARITHHASRITHRLWRYGFMGLLLAAMLIVPVRHAQFNINWLTEKWDTSHRDYWLDALGHPLENDAAMMATWGDLTTMWYLQQWGHIRPEIAGLYPPTEAVAAAWLAQGKPLYVAGPVLDAWTPAERARYQFLPWGRLARVLPAAADAATVLPDVSPLRVTFNRMLAVDGVQFPATVMPGQQFTVTFAGRTLAELPENVYYSLRLVGQNGERIAQKDDVVRPGWFPTPRIPAHVPWVGAYSLTVPADTPAGTYQIRMVIYDGGGEWVMENEERVLTVGAVTIP